MTTLEPHMLVAVVGAGSSTTSYEAPLVRGQATQTDYARCLDTVVAQTAAQYPSTRPWWNPFAGDRNARPRAAATVANLRETCGLPPSS